jgi:hypothetical protein
MVSEISLNVRPVTFYCLEMEEGWNTNYRGWDRNGKTVLNSD